MQEYLSIRDAADLLGVSIDYIMTMRRDGLPCYDISCRAARRSTFRIKRTDLLDWLERKRVA